MSGCCCEKCRRIEWLQTAAEANGDGQIFDVLGYPAATLQVYGDLSGGSDVEVQFLSGADWLPLPVENVSTGVVTTTGIITAEGTYRVNTTGLQKIKAEVTGYAGTDSINVVATAVCEAGASASSSGGEITGDVDVLSVVPGTGATNLGKAEDAGHTTGDVGVMALTVRNDTPGTLVNTNLDYAPQQVNANGLLRVEAGGVSAVVNGSFTRPNDTTTYAAGEVVSNSTSAPTAITFANVARFPAGSGIITGALLVDSANQALKGSFELWLFDTAVTVDNDNTAFTPTDAELATLIGIIEFTTSFIGDATAGAGGNVAYPVVGRNVPFKCTGVLQDIYGVLVVRNALVPVAEEVFTIRLRVLQD